MPDKLERAKWGQALACPRWGRLSACQEPRSGSASIARHLKHSAFAAAILLLVQTIAAQTQPPDPAFTRGSELYRAGDCVAAVAQLSQSQNPRALLVRARCYLDARDFTKAAAVLDAYNKAVPADELGIVLAARVAAGAGNTNSAIATLETLRAQKPASLAVRDALADMYAQSGKPVQAADLYRNVLTDDKDDIGALLGLAKLTLASSRWSDAIEQLRTVLALSPDNPDAIAGLARAQFQLTRYSEAVPTLQRALRLQPGDWDLTRMLGECYVRSQDWPSVIRTLEYDSIAHPADEKITAWMVQAFEQTRQPGAETYYQDVTSKAPGNFTAQFTLANLLYDRKDFAGAKTHYAIVLKAKPDLFEISDRMGQIAEQEKNLEQARDYYQAACRSPQATAAMKNRLARVYFRLGDWTSAQPALEAILRADPANREIKMMLLETATRTGKTEDAVRYAAELLPGDKNNVTLLRIVADDALKHDRAAEASQYYEQALAQNDKDKDLLKKLVQLYTDNDSLTQAEQAPALANRYVSLYPDDPEGYLLLANLYRRKADYPNAHTFFDQGFAKIAQPAPAAFSWAYTSYGLLLFVEGKYEDALAPQLKAIEMDPADAGALYNLALTYIKLKRKEEVIAVRDKLSGLNTPELLNSLDELIQKAKLK